MTATDYIIETDGVTVWINSGEGFCYARFGRMGIDVHRVPDFDRGVEKECLFCTHEVVVPKDWETFKTKVLEFHGIPITDLHKPKRFRITR